MVRERWWPLAGTKSGINKPRRRGKRVREVFLGPEIVLSGELKSCGTLVAEESFTAVGMEGGNLFLGVIGLRKVKFRLRARALVVASKGGPLSGWGSQKIRWER